MPANLDGTAPFRAKLNFASAEEAARQAGGVALAARAARQAWDDGTRALQIVVADGARLPAAALADVQRACPDMWLSNGRDYPAWRWREPDVAEIVRATGKAGDGLVSRWVNRPLSQAITRLLLRHAPWVRPGHVTLFVALLGLAMLAAMLFGGWAGFVGGALLFHIASMLDGVDGELARATWRTSESGALADTIVDQCINLAFFVGLTAGVARFYGPAATAAAGWAVTLFLTGVGLMALMARAHGGGQLNFLKAHYRARFPDGAARRITDWLVIFTSRDFFALFFAVALPLGLGGFVPWLLLGFAALWLLLILLAVRPMLRRAQEGSAASAEVEVAARRPIEIGGDVHLGE